MELQEIEALMKAMNDHPIKKICIKREGFSLELEKESHVSEVLAPAPMSAPIVETPIVNKEAPSSKSLDKKEVSQNFIESPMVGTFYSALSPDDPPFVKVGDVVQTDTVVCIIEAMKVMNELKAGKEGTIVEVLHKSGEPVEFASNLFRLET